MRRLSDKDQEILYELRIPAEPESEHWGPALVDAPEQKPATEDEPDDDDDEEEDDSHVAAMYAPLSEIHLAPDVAFDDLDRETLLSVCSMFYSNQSETTNRIQTLVDMVNRRDLIIRRYRHRNLTAVRAFALMLFVLLTIAGLIIWTCLR